MLCIVNDSKDPYFNLAAEEYLLKYTTGDICMLWRSHPTVIVGKHQNTFSEVNFREAKALKIDVARRLTGGGTVFHDEGNLNFTFIRKGEAGRLIDFEKNLRPVIGFLDIYGINAYPGKKNEILVNELKISGNAEHIYRERVLHHGTLLFDTDLRLLHRLITRQGGEYLDRSVQSNRSRVTNLKGFLPTGTSIESFIDEFHRYLRQLYDCEIRKFTGPETGAIKMLVKEKYSTWEWIYGWSPDYTFSNEVTCAKGSIKVYFSTHRGVIREFSLLSDFLPESYCRILSGTFINARHRLENFRDILTQYHLAEHIPDIGWDDLVFSFF